MEVEQSFPCCHSGHLVEDYNEKANAVAAELYKLNVYGASSKSCQNLPEMLLKDTGSFFKPHKDTPRAENMFASLVIVFPTPHEGGSLILRHKGQKWTFNPTFLGKSEIGYIAFYSDVKHEVLPVTSGYRVTLTYNLYFKNDETESKVDLSNSLTASRVLDTPFKAALQELLNDSSFLLEGGRLGFGLYHQYPYNTKRCTSLRNIIKFFKGSDATLYRVCTDLDLEANVRVLYSEPWSKSQVLFNCFVHVGGEIRENIINLLRDQHGGEVIRRDEDDRDRENKDGDVPELVWATPKTRFNRLTENYIVYGNEHSAADLYGDICLIVEIGDYASRRDRY